MSNPFRIVSPLFAVMLASACSSAEPPQARHEGNKDNRVATQGTPTVVVDEFVAHATLVTVHEAGEPAAKPALQPPAVRKTSLGAEVARVDRCPKGSFFDPRGECWSCPRGYHRTIFAVTASNACERRLRIRHRHVAGRRNATGLFKTDCKRGWFLHGLSGVCYRCPKGYKRTIFSVAGSTACERWEGPHWTSATFAKQLTCGNNGNRACTILERVPSCDQGLKEDKRAVCVPLLPGEVPFLAGLAAKSEAIADLGTEMCHDILSKVPSVSLPNPVATMSLECRRRAMIGFACELPGMIDQVSKFNDYSVKFARAWEGKPCSDWAAPGRPLCAAAVATIGDAPQVLACVGAAIQKGVFGELDAGEVCEASGQIAFQIAAMRELGNMKGKGKRESRLDQLKRLLTNTGKAGNAAAELSQQLDRIAECRVLD